MITTGKSPSIASEGEQWKGASLYFDALGGNVTAKAALVLSNLLELQTIAKEDEIFVVDIGCAGGALLAAIHQRLPKAHLIGIDFLESAIAELRKKIPVGHFHVLDAARDAWPIPDRCVDLVNMSSVCHELFGNDARADKMPPVIAALSEARRVLKPRGRLIVREPILPEQPNRVMKLTMSRTRTLASTRPRVAEPYAALSEADLFEKFCREWNFIGAAPVEALACAQPELEACYAVPAWIVGEYARKRTFIDHVGNWQSEMCEQNAAFTTEELRACAVAAGFSSEVLQCREVMEDDYYGRFREGDPIALTSLHGDPIEQSTALPSHLHLVIEAH